MVHVAPADSESIVPYSDGSWPALRNTEGVELRQNPDKAFASGRIQVALGDAGAAARKVLIQTAHRYRSGQLVYSSPKAFDLPEKPGRIYPTGTPLQLILKAASARAPPCSSRSSIPTRTASSRRMTQATGSRSRSLATSCTPLLPTSSLVSTRTSLCTTPR